MWSSFIASNSPRNELAFRPKSSRTRNLLRLNEPRRRWTRSRNVRNLAASFGETGICSVLAAAGKDAYSCGLISLGRKRRPGWSKARSRFSRLDDVLCAAGDSPDHDFLELTEAEFDAAININLTGPLLLGQTAARHWVRHGQNGVIVNVTSVSVKVANTGAAVYCASKAGWHALPRPWRWRRRHQGEGGSRPGATRTPAVDTVWDKEAMLAPILPRTPLAP
jgi:NAD(P)-dependent dehydrogenase (short-subunit alcohol dehydrogenase family)